MDTGHWNFEHEFDPDKAFGFVYRIIEIDSGREYIGKKQFKSHRKKKVAGRKNRKTVTKDTNWLTYTGSSKELNEQIIIKGKENYKFDILSIHETRGSLYYAEVRLQVMEDVLRKKLPDNNTKKYYNKAISAVKFIPPADTEDEIRLRTLKLLGIKEYTEHLTEEQLDIWLSENCKGERNKNFGRTDAKNGKTFEEFYGDEKAAEIKKKMGQSGKDNPMYGRPCYYNMTDEEIINWKKNVGKGIKGIKRSDETKKKMSEAQKGLKSTVVKCPHCGKQGDQSNMTRYHFNNCKHKN